MEGNVFTAPRRSSFRRAALQKSPLPIGHLQPSGGDRAQLSAAMGWLRHFARHLLGPFFAPLRDLFWSVFAFTERTAAAWLAAYLLLAFAVYLSSQRSEPLWRGFVRYLFPKEVYAHPSARADVLYFVVDKALFCWALGGIAVSGHLVTERLLRRWPAAPAASGSALWAEVVLTFAVFLAFDFGAFSWHLLTHRLPVLWAFHRVHHAVEVLTPLSNYREHPVDSLGRSAFQGVLIGVVQASLVHLLPGARPLHVFGLNAVYLPFLFFANARHSHVQVHFGARLSRFFSSPAQHQCHDGVAPEHVDVNFGLALSVWDWLLGTLYIPKARERISYGLIGEQRPFPTLSTMYLRPFADAWRAAVGAREPGGDATASGAPAPPSS